MPITTKTLAKSVLLTLILLNFSSVNAQQPGQPTGDVKGSTENSSEIFEGSEIEVPYVPYGKDIRQVMYIANSGTSTGDIVVDAIDENGKVYPLGVVGSCRKKQIIKLGKLISKALKSVDFKGSKIAYKISIDAPNQDIRVYAAYNTGQERGFVGEITSTPNKG